MPLFLRILSRSSSSAGRSLASLPPLVSSGLVVISPFLHSSFPHKIRNNAQEETCRASSITKGMKSDGPVVMAITITPAALRNAVRCNHHHRAMTTHQETRNMRVEDAEGDAQRAAGAVLWPVIEAIDCRAIDELRGELSVSGSANSDGADDDDRATPTGALRSGKKRRSTHQIRKEEKQALLEQIEELQQRLDALEMEQDSETKAMHRSVALKAQLASSVEQNFMAIAGAQSMLSSYKTGVGQSPLTSYVHLTADPVQRRACLGGLYNKKIDLATNYMLERTRFIDLRHEHCQMESYEMPNGDFIVSRFEVSPMGRAFSVRRVYEELMLFMSHHEICVSENLGILTVIEAEETVSDVVRQNRVLSTLPDGVNIESNMAMFSRYVEQNGSQAYGIGAVDFIDEDDLYPYMPTRIRKDITGMGFVAACPSDIDGAPPIVTMTRWMSVRLRAPAFRLTMQQEIMARESMRVWGSVMLKVIQERLGLR